VSLALTIGSTANQNDRHLRGVTVLFLAQFFNVNLSVGQQLPCAVSACWAASARRRAGGSLPVVAMILGMVAAAGGFPDSQVDRFLDMCPATST
jgi:DAACS family dicarboxylate/amino acid:cation (Na+ or H+) symporter